jgi:hypothetical protein
MPPATPPRYEAFVPWVDQLAALLRSPPGTGRIEQVAAALDGEASRRLRAAVPIGERRRDGVFFTSRAIADRLLGSETRTIRRSDTIADPACGAGDLLLAAARALPCEHTVRRTLKTWGERLVGRDLDPVLVRTTLLRLALLASSRVGRAWSGDEEALIGLLPAIAVGDGHSLDLDSRNTLVLLNPPYGAIVADEPWASGRISRAAVFVSHVVERLAPGASIRAVLPDVLRSGSNYRRWRLHMEQALDLRHPQAVGRFDAWTDVDVFLLRGRRRAGKETRHAAWWPDESGPGLHATVGDHFTVSVGPVVPHRDRQSGDESPYLRARDLPLGGAYRPGAVKLRHSGRRFAPPLVVVRRTSRPSREGSRLTATLIRGRVPVLVENHLLVCEPKDRRLATCERLMTALTTDEMTTWFDQRLRCRHLTVVALRSAPLRSWPLPT